MYTFARCLARSADETIWPRGKTWIIVSDARRGPRCRVRYGLGGTWIIAPGKRRGLQCGRRFGGKTWINVSGILIYLSSDIGHSLVPGAAPSHGDAGSPERGLASCGSTRVAGTLAPVMYLPSVSCVLRRTRLNWVVVDRWMSTCCDISSSEYPGNSYGEGPPTTKPTPGVCDTPVLATTHARRRLFQMSSQHRSSQGVKSSINRAERSAACRAPATMWTRRQMWKRELWCVGCGTRTGRWHRRRMRVLRTWTHRCTAGRWKSRFHLRSRLLWPGY